MRHIKTDSLDEGSITRSFTVYCLPECGDVVYRVKKTIRHITNGHSNITHATFDDELDAMNHAELWLRGEA